MKKIFALFLALIMTVSLCGCQVADAPAAESNHFESLNLEFVPSSDAEVMLSTATYLPEILKAEMAKRGYHIDTVTLTVGESYDATGEALATGNVDVAWLPAGTYAAYSDKVSVMLTATRNGLCHDSTDPMEWNGIGNKTHQTADIVNAYRALILAGPSDYGKELAKKVSSGEALTWEDLDKAEWAVQKTTSSAGYIYPSMWLMENYDGKRIGDLSNVYPLAGGYRRAFTMAAEEKADIILVYADARIDYEEVWTMPAGQLNQNGMPGMGRTDSIWEEMNVIAVTDSIFNDTVSISKSSEFFTPAAAKALQESLTAIIGTDAGKAIFAAFNHQGYVLGDDSNYDIARNALSVVTQVNESEITDLPDSAEGDGDTVDAAALKAANGMQH